VPRKAKAPAPASQTRETFPPAVPLLAVLGLAILCLCTIPAIHKQQRLEREHTGLQRRAQAAAAEVERLRRELRDGAEQEYLRTKATRALLYNGMSYIARRDARYRPPAPPPASAGTQEPLPPPTR
jgi:hypothetical protein